MNLKNSLRITISHVIDLMNCISTVIIICFGTRIHSSSVELVVG